MTLLSVFRSGTHAAAGINLSMHPLRNAVQIGDAYGRETPSISAPNDVNHPQNRNRAFLPQVERRRKNLQRGWAFEKYSIENVFRSGIHVAVRKPLSTLPNAAQIGSVSFLRT